MGARRFCTLIAVLSALLVAAASSARAQAGNYPDKAVTIISDAGAGSSVDVATRVIADGLSKIWGQTVAVVNHPGANGSIAARAASDATGDGYTLYAPASSTFIALPTAAPNLPVKLPRDFLPIGFVVEQPMFVAVDPASGISSLRQLIDRAKAAPGTISAAVSGVGRITHLTSILIQQRAGITLTAVPYTGGPSAALADVSAGRVTMIIEGYTGIIGAVNAGQVKLIATGAPQRLAEFPDLPTVAETIPGLSASGWVMMAAPLGTAAPIIAKVSADVTKVVDDPDIRKKLAVTGNYTHAMTPQETQAFVVKQQEIWQPVVQSIAPR
ncbi:MAG TPA: tripartite tricarboxylate transporter substrate binding protein [Xanthobacteraceae bacterium]|nr:tripartite tricarboxylate transporter substrate binding protein [Xanthobacteraceae bacterium]